MKDINIIINESITFFETLSEDDWSMTKKPGKWSRKEILGHLADSAFNNLQRFTEIQFHPKPYLISKYNQDELVKANMYQDQAIGSIINLWSAINKQIGYVMEKQSSKNLAFEVEVEAGNIQSLEWLMNDYIIHMEYHLDQIRNY